MRPVALGFSAFSLALSAIGGYLIAAYTVAKLEDSAQSRVATALNASGQEWATVEADGMIVRLQGVAPTEQDRLAAVETTARIVGFERLYDRSAVAQVTEAPVPDFRLELARDGNSVRVFGLIFEEDMIAIRRQLEQILGLEMDATLVVETSTPSPESWAANQSIALEIASLTDKAKVALSADKLDVEAILPGPEAANRFKDSVVTAVDNKISLSIQTFETRVPMEHFEIRLDTADGGTFTQCVAQTAQGRDRILGAARSVGIGIFPECPLGLGTPLEEWETRVLIAIEELGRFGNASLVIRDTEVQYDLSDPTEGDARDLARSIQERLGPPFAVAVNAPQPENETTEAPVPEGNVWFSLILDEDGQATLAGFVSETVQEPLKIFSEAQFGLGKISDEFQRGQNLPISWTQWIFATVEAVGMLDTGDALLSATGLTLSGSSGNEDAETKIAAHLRSQLGAGFPMVLDVVFVPPPEPAEILPNPEFCASEIANVLQDNQIVFAPSSAVIEQDSLPVITEIAAILHGCQHARFEIGGHTDSQGREEMNRNLSQSRAESVLDALLAQNMLLGELSAVGYGESEPIADNETEEGRAINRRIEFKLLGVADGQN